MANFYDYIKWRGDLEFERDPFNPVDNAIFSQLAYLPMDDIVPGPDESGSISIEEAGEISAVKYKKYLSNINIDYTITNGAKVIQAIRETSRYKDCRLFGFVNNIDFRRDKQFSAYCVRLNEKRNNNYMLVIFRGTDLNLAGWKEDMNMSFNNSVPAQKEAVSYLNKMAKRYSNPLIIAGHSKGGNLAIYASAFCNKKPQRRIVRIYNNDGPGFLKDVIMSEGYKAICERIFTYIPQSSLVGMLLEHAEIPHVVKSSSVGLLQHDLPSWEVIYNNFVGAELTEQCRFIDKVIRDWLDQIDEEQRELFIEAIYKILTAGNVQSFADFPADFIGTALSMINVMKNMNDNTKKLILKIIGSLFTITGKNLGQQAAGIKDMLSGKR